MGCHLAADPDVIRFHAGARLGLHFVGHVAKGKPWGVADHSVEAAGSAGEPNRPCDISGYVAPDVVPTCRPQLAQLDFANSETLYSLLELADQRSAGFSLYDPVEEVALDGAV